MRHRSALALTVAAAALGGCTGSSNNGPNNQAAVMAVCDQMAANAERCGRPACEVDDARRRCSSYAPRFRPEALAVLMRCGSTQSCPGDGGSSNPMEEACVRSGLYALGPTQAHRDAAAAICRGCPAAGGGMTPEECEQNFYAPRDSGEGSIGSLLLALNEQTVNGIRNACGNVSPDSGNLCGVQVLFCVAFAAGADFSGSSCRDAGTMD